MTLVAREIKVAKVKKETNELFEEKRVKKVVLVHLDSEVKAEILEDLAVKVYVALKEKKELKETRWVKV